jgi:hypothetical protein
MYRVGTFPLSDGTALRGKIRDMTLFSGKGIVSREFFRLKPDDFRDDGFGL